MIRFLYCNLCEYTTSIFHNTNIPHYLLLMRPFCLKRAKHIHLQELLRTISIILFPCPCLYVFPLCYICTPCVLFLFLLHVIFIRPVCCFCFSCMLYIGLPCTEFVFRVIWLIGYLEFHYLHVDHDLITFLGHMRAPYLKCLWIL